MKKFSYFVIGLLFSNISIAQWTTSGTNIYNSNTGNVGIGTSTPGAKIDVNGMFFLNRPSLMGDVANTIGIANGSYFALAPSNLSSTNNSYIILEFPTNNSFRIGTGYDGHLGTGIYRDLEFGRYTGTPYLIIKDGGTVGIGTSTPGTTNKLSVEGTIGARKVIVTQAAWSDFVFDKTYKLSNLANVENYIKLNNHLPDIPSEMEVKKDGLDLGLMDAKLLQKIEELTLYVIELKRENRQIKAEIKKIQKYSSSKKSNLH